MQLTVTPRAQRLMHWSGFALLGVIYVFAWLAPAIGFYHDDGVYLVTARSLFTGHGYMVDSLPHPVLQTKYPPLFPVLLGLFTLVSQSPLWLKLLPLACATGWLYLTFKLLRHLGATLNAAIFLVLITAASPQVIFLNTNLMSEPLFALLLTACLYTLATGGNPFLAGLFAGLATITRIAGVPLIAAGVLTLLFQRRLKDSVQFMIAATLLAAPWFGWAASHTNMEPYYGLGNYSSLSILTKGLPVADKFRVLMMNLMFLFSAPFTLLTGITSVSGTLVTAFATLLAIITRRRAIPDLFVLLYCLLLITWAGPPQRFLAPVLPLALWILWRWFNRFFPVEIIAMVMLATAITQTVYDYQRLPLIVKSGVFPTNGVATNEWSAIKTLCDYLKTQTPPESIVMANLDPVIYLNSGRKAVRGFSPNGFDLFYAPTRRPVRAAQLLQSIHDSQVDYVAISPDRDFAEAPGFLQAVLAMARDGFLEPVGVPGLPKGYLLFKTTGK